jgi:hypothetical protein
MNEHYETCGFCQGRGHVYGSMFNREGRRLYSTPPVESCPYCSGSGECVDGRKLWPAPSREQIIHRQEGTDAALDDEDEEVGTTE